MAEGDTITHEVLSPNDRRTMLGQAVIEHGEAKVRLAQLDKKTDNIGFTLERLAKSMRQSSPEGKVLHLKNLLGMLKQDEFDWASAGEHGLWNLAEALEQAIIERDRLARERANLGDTT